MIKYLALFIVLVADPQNNYPKIFGEEYLDAIQRLQKQKETIIRLTNEHSANRKLIMAVVFPELLRYSALSNLFETEALELFYVENGSSAVDFSIGLFQMKPSFAEKLEIFVQQSNTFPARLKELLNYSTTNEKTIRSQRIVRLKMFNQQMIYLICFEKIIEKRFPNCQLMSIDDKLKFFATAYNYGFDKSFDDIRKQQNKRFFPYGSKFHEEQYAYSDIALYFYKETYKRIFSD